MTARTAGRTTISRRAATLFLVAVAWLGASRAVGQGIPSWDEPERRDQRPSDAELEQRILAELGRTTHEAAQTYVSQLCARLAGYADPGTRKIRCTVIDPANANAFTLGSGAVFISRGLLALAGSESDLAGVLAHEIAHVVERHAAARTALEEGLSPFSIGFARASYLAAFSRDQERTADQRGQELAAAAGFDPAGLPSFLKRLESEDRLRFGASRIPGFFDTHPGNVERMSEGFQKAKGLTTWERKPGIARSDEAFLKILDGLLVGPNPSEGIFRESRFLHPDLGFTVFFPDGWTLVNTPAAVGAVSPAGNARFAMELAEEGQDPKSAADAFLRKRGRTVIQSIDAEQAINVNGLPGYEVRGSGRTPLGPIRAQLTWLVLRGRVYLLSALSLGIDDAFRGRGHAMVRSFREMTPHEREGITVLRLRTVTAKGGETLAALSKRSGNEVDLARTAVVNGVSADAVLREGQPVRVALEEPYPVQ